MHNKTQSKQNIGSISFIQGKVTNIKLLGVSEKEVEERRFVRYFETLMERCQILTVLE